MDAVGDAILWCIEQLKDAGGWRKVQEIEDLARYLQHPNAADLPAAFVFQCGVDPVADNSSTARLRQVIQVRISVAVVVGSARPGPGLHQTARAANQAVIDTLFGARPPSLERPLQLGAGTLRQVFEGVVAYEQQFTSRFTATATRTIP
jgi:hypothetical protein